MGNVCALSISVLQALTAIIPIFVIVRLEDPWGTGGGVSQFFTGANFYALLVDYSLEIFFENINSAFVYIRQLSSPSGVMEYAGDTGSFKEG